MKLEVAADFRREIGDVGGLCASLNVLSLFAQRWAFVIRMPKTGGAASFGRFPGATMSGADLEAVLAFAQARSEESLALARRHDIPFHRGQALLSLAVCRLRQGATEHALAAVNEVCGMSDLDPRSDLEARYCVAMWTLGSATDLSRGARSAFRKFENVATDARTMLDLKPDARIAQIWEAAALNRDLCARWGQETPRALAKEVVLEYRKPMLSQDRARLAELATVVPPSPLDAVQVVLDPLGP